MSKNPTDQPLNREGWLTAFANEVAPIITSRTGLRVPMDKIRVSCSFPRTRTTPNRKGGYTTGVCMHGSGHKSGLHELFINPLKANVLPVKDGDQGVGDILIHEMLHACLDVKVGHKAKFAKAAKDMGLEGKPTSTTAGPEAKAIIQSIVDKIGDYPHEALDGEWGKKQTTRLLKVQCVDCGYINEAGNGYTARITMTWIENAGLPTCPCGAIMSLIMDNDEDKAIISLTPVESSATYRVPTAEGEGYDDRFQVRRISSEHFGERWSVIDFGERTVKDTFTDSTPRIVAADSKLNALELIDAVREGLFTWDEHEGGLDDEVEDAEFARIADMTDAEYDAYLAVLADGEDEDAEHPEDAEPETSWTRVHPVSKQAFVHHFDYAVEAERRDEQGTAKSERIAAGAEPAMD